MAATCYRPRNPSRILAKILAKLGCSSVGDLKQHLWTVTSGEPPGLIQDYPGMRSKDLIYDMANDDVWQVTLLGDDTTQYLKVFD